jgi:hypothetical protein
MSGKRRHAQALEAELRRSERSPQPFAVAMVDRLRPTYIASCISALGRQQSSGYERRTFCKQTRSAPMSLTLNGLLADDLALVPWLVATSVDVDPMMESHQVEGQQECADACLDECPVMSSSARALAADAAALLAVATLTPNVGAALDDLAHCAGTHGNELRRRSRVPAVA